MTAKGTNPWLVLSLVCIAQFMVILDATVVNVALPSIQEDLEMSPSELQWVVNSYTLIFGGFLLLGGRAGDLIGRKRLFLIGLVIFTVASLLNGLATSSEFLILARGLQGLGAALVSPAALSIVTTTFAEGSERTKAMGVWSAIAAGGGAVGLLLGGILTDLFSWPWIFFVNIPVGIAAFVLSLRYVPESKDEKAHKAFDIAGAVTVTAGLIALVYGLVKTAEEGWVSLHTLGFGVLAVVLLAAFVVIEHRSAEPLVRLSIFLQRTIRSANVVMLLVAAGLFAMFYFNSLYFQRVLGYSPIEAGLAFVPFTLGIVIGAGLSQFLVRTIGARSVGIAGMLLGAVGMLLFLRPRRRRHLRHRSPARDHADLDRDGHDVRARDPDRDERNRRRRRGPRLGAPEHVAADRRRARARGPLHPRDARRRPSRSSRSAALPIPQTPRARSSTASTSPTSRAQPSSPPARSCWR